MILIWFISLDLINLISPNISYSSCLFINGLWVKLYFENRQFIHCCQAPVHVCNKSIVFWAGNNTVVCHLMRELELKTCIYTEQQHMKSEHTSSCSVYKFRHRYLKLSTDQQLHVQCIAWQLTELLNCAHVREIMQVDIFFPARDGLMTQPVFYFLSWPEQAATVSVIPAVKYKMNNYTSWTTFNQCNELLTPVLFLQTFSDNSYNSVKYDITNPNSKDLG